MITEFHRINVFLKININDSYRKEEKDQEKYVGTHIYLISIYTHRTLEFNRDN